MIKAYTPNPECFICPLDDCYPNDRRCLLYTGTNKALTPKQQTLLSFLHTYHQQHGHSPTTQEISHGLSIKWNSTIHSHLTNLEKLGYIKRTSRKRRPLIIQLIGDPPNETRHTQAPAAPSLEEN